MESRSEFVLNALKNRIQEIIELNQALANESKTDTQLCFQASVRTAKDLQEFIKLLEKE